MRDLFFQSLSSVSSSRDSLFHRIRENFRQAFAPERIFPSSANGAPLHLPRWSGSPRSGRAQSASLLTHAIIITALALLTLPARHFKTPALPPGVKIPGKVFTPAELWSSRMGQYPSGGRASGGGRTPIPATSGSLVPVSSIQILRPSLPPQHESIVPMPPTILDPAAPPVLTPVNKIGLPWMSEETNSPGPGDSNTVGNSNGKTMGDGPVDGPGGLGSSLSSYRPGTTLPICVYCPNPQYSDEARQAKVQGKVTLRVLVGADGRPSQARIIQGIGLGLDDRAAQSVRTWKFVPAHDAARRAVATWITIEVVFRLI